MSAFGSKQSFVPDQPNVRFAPQAAIPERSANHRVKMRRTIALATALLQFDLGLWSVAPADRTTRRTRRHGTHGEPWIKQCVRVRIRIGLSRFPSRIAATVRQKSPQNIIGP